MWYRSSYHCSWLFGFLEVDRLLKCGEIISDFTAFYYNEEIFVFKKPSITNFTLKLIVIINILNFAGQLVIVPIIINSLSRMHMNHDFAFHLANVIFGLLFYYVFYRYARNHLKANNINFSVINGIKGSFTDFNNNIGKYVGIILLASICIISIQLFFAYSGNCITYATSNILRNIIPNLTIKLIPFQDSLVNATGNSFFWTGIIMTLVSYIYGTFIEEYTMRYGFFSLFSHTRNIILINAICFGLIHYQLIITIYEVVVNFIISLLFFSLIYLYTKNIILTTLLHFINNTVAKFIEVFSSDHFKEFNVLFFLFLLFIAVGFGLLWIIYNAKCNNWKLSFNEKS